MNIQLSDHFTYKRLLRFVLPSITMMICMSLYSIVDGLFVSNYVGKTPFAAVNLIMPILMGINTFGFMLGTGGSAIISKTLGEGKKERANKYFSMLIYVAVISGVILSALGIVFARPISIVLKAEGEMLEQCVLYGRILFCFTTASMLQVIFQSFFIVAEKPNISLIVSICSGLTNVALDYLFIAIFQWGIAGAAFATAIGQVIGGVFPIIYFSRKNTSPLRFCKFHFNGRVLLNTCINGSSEMVTNLSSSVVNTLYNSQLMQLAGEDGVAAFGVIMYTNFIFAAIFIGYSIGSAPIVSYHYGAGGHEELRNIFRKSLILISAAGVFLTALSQILAEPLTRIFVGYDPELFALTCHGFKIFSFTYLVCGFNIWGSAFFTALNNGAVSAAISFLRTLVFQIGAVLILPIFLKIDGVWSADILAEVLALTITAYFLFKYRNRYHYAGKMSPTA